ncbi:MAG: hypothetical protein ABI379_12355 [Rhodanobacter sp.]
MRKLYSSPRNDNIDRVVALMDARGIETKVSNRSRYDHSTWKRFSYVERYARRPDWPEVWIVHPEDYKAARLAFRDLGLEPLIARATELAQVPETTPELRRKRAVARARRIALVAVLAMCAVLMLRYLQVF